MGCFMGKYTEQTKLTAVQDYCSGNGGLRDVAHRHGVDFSSLRQWVAAYQVHGAAGLKEKRLQHYSADFKLVVLKRMREEQLSYRQAAALFDIRKFNIIGLWERRYDVGGFDALTKQPKRAGRPKKMPTPTSPVQPDSPDDESRSRDEWSR
ncbi:transposase [Pseudomonas frederiksbergensis]